MAELDGKLYAFDVWTPGNPNFPTGLPGPTDPIGLRLLDQDAFAAEKGVAGAVGPSGRRTVNGVMASVNDWFLDRFWISPSPIEFGNIIGSKAVLVSIFSTNDQTRVLQSIDLSALGGGVSVTDNAPPLTFPFLASKTIELTATSDGPNSFAADVVFTFDGPQTVEILATGRRLVLFYYPPEAPIGEQLSWMTDVIKRRDGSEQRRSLRTAPRSTFELRIRGRDVPETHELRNLLIAFRAFIFGLPLWHEARTVSSGLTAGGLTIQVPTADGDFRVGNSIMVWEPILRTSFDATIASFDASSITLEEATEVDVTADALVVPVVTAYLSREPSYQDAADGALDTIVVFETVDNADQAFADQAALEADFPVHPVDGLPVLWDPNLIDSQITRRFSTAFSRIDAGLGRPVQFAQDPVSSIDSPKETDLSGQAEVWKWRQLLHWLRGSWRSFYLPTFRADLVPTANFNLDAAGFNVENCGLATFFGAEQPHVSLMLELPDGSQYIGVVDSISEVDADTEAVTLSRAFDPLSSTTVDASTAKISWAELVRIDGDVATFRHLWAGESTLRFSVRTVRQ